MRKVVYEKRGDTGIVGYLDDGREGESCRVYWGSHGCDFPRGHTGPHECDCCKCDNHPDTDSGCVAKPPYYGPDTRFYGEDAEALGLPSHEEPA